MRLSDILTPSLMACHQEDISTKKQALEAISKIISDADSRIKFTDVLEALQKRERLGSTAIGHGVAIPHARVPNVTQPICVLITLKNTIDFDSAEEIHNEPVNILFSLIVPQEATQTHLDLLADIATKLKSKHYQDTLRQASNKQALYEAAIAHVTQPH